MAVGRNDPCPCGSRKKYKKCCMKKEQAAPPPPEGITPEEVWAAANRAFGKERSAADPFWREFEGRTYEGRIELFLENVGDREKMAQGTAYEMLAAITGEAMGRRDWDRINSLVGALRERQPAVFEVDAPFYLRWMMITALAAGDAERLRACARDLGERGGKDVDTTYNAISLLAYHGQLPAILDLMRLAWPKVQEAPGLMSWVVPEFAAMLRLYEVLDYLEHTASPDASDPELLRRLEFDEDFEPGNLPTALDDLSGRATRVWTLDDFKVSRCRDEYGDERPGWKLTRAAQENLNALCNQFVAYLHGRGMSYTRADLGASELHNYVPMRLAGELRERESMLESVARARAGRPKPRYALHLPDNVLCPDSETLDVFLGHLLHFINPQCHKAAAAMEVVPAWLSFLQERGLLDAETAADALPEMKELSATLANLLEAQSSDPLLGPALRNWA